MLIASYGATSNENGAECSLQQRRDLNSPHNSFRVEEKNSARDDSFKVLIAPIEFIDLRQTDEFAKRLENTKESVAQFYSKMTKQGLNLEWKTLDQAILMSASVESYDSGSRAKMQNAVPIVIEAQRILATESPIDEFDFIVLATPPTTLKHHISTSISVLQHGEYIDSTILSGDFWESGGRWEILAHELGHGLGLLDLYSAGVSDSKTHSDSGFSSQFEHMGPYDLMNSPTGSGPELTAWNRFMLGYLQAEEIVCIPKGISNIKLEAIQKNFGVRALFIKLDETRMIIVENRQRIGFDRGLFKNSVGLIVYEVNLSVKSGFGPLKLLSRSRDSSSYRYAISTGQSIEYAGFKISSVSQHGSKLLVEIRKLTLKSNSNKS